MFIVLMMPTWLDETRRQNSTNLWCVGVFSIFRIQHDIKKNSKTMNYLIILNKIQSESFFVPVSALRINETNKV
jgi:hypothetical protein